MQVVIFVSGDGAGSDEMGPTLFLPDHPAVALPVHPRSLGWRYLATVDQSDHLLDADRPQIEAALAEGRPYIARRLLR